MRRIRRSSSLVVLLGILALARIAVARPVTLDQALLVRDPLVPVGHPCLRPGMSRALVVRTSQREVHVVDAPGSQTRSSRRLPEGTPPLVADWGCAWTVTPGPVTAEDFAMIRVATDDGWVERREPRIAADASTAIVTRALAADPDSVFLDGGLRFAKTSNRIERGHLDAFPGLLVIAARADRSMRHYLAIDPRLAASPALRLLWRGPDGTWASADLGAADEAASHARDGASVLVAQGGRLRRFHASSLLQIEDLTPRLPAPVERVLEAPAGGAWALLRESSDAAATLTRVDSPAGAPLRAAALPRGFEPIGDDGRDLWLASLDEAGVREVVAVDAATGSEARSRIATRHGERLAAWKEVGLAAGGFVGGLALLPVLIPVGIGQAMAAHHRDPSAPATPSPSEPGVAPASEGVVVGNAILAWQLVSSLSTRDDLLRGDPADGVVTEDVVVDGRVVIARGAPVRATILWSQKLSGNGPPSIGIEALWVTAVDGGLLRLWDTRGFGRSDSSRGRTQKHLTIDAGTPYTSRVVGGIEIELTPAP